ncbi:unnamed protein product [Caenorhabditis auriculariae]|uniref:Cullin family profile domain-containing protein n=1 Tax=Caenorhabditis auriculariae TaxID=2777116 RepID=A0A8S1HUN9_9PELO|nr:unnamed protein product [Caenorhabditis auriculariae]
MPAGPTKGEKPEKRSLQRGSSKRTMEVELKEGSPKKVRMSEEPLWPTGDEEPPFLPNAPGSSQDNFSHNYRPSQKSSSSPHAETKKKVAIKNLRKKDREVEDINRNGEGPLILREDIEEWPEIQENIDAIFSCTPTRTGLEQLFTLVQIACEKHKMRTIHDNLRVVLMDFALKLKTQLDSGDVMALSESTCEEYLLRFWKIWQVYPIRMELVRNVFLHLDRNVSASSCEIDFLPIWEASMRVFRRTFFLEVSKEYHTNKLFVALFYDLQRMMKRLDAESNAIRDLISMISTVRVQEEFLAYLTRELREFYNNERHRLLPGASCGEYMRYVDGQVNEYAHLMQLHFADVTALKAVHSVLLETLVASALPYVFQNGFDLLMTSPDVEDARCTFSLCVQCSGGEETMRNHFVAFIKKTGTQLMSSCQDADFFNELLSFKKRMDRIVTEAFRGCLDEVKFRQAVSDSFASFINTGGNKAAELIAKYFHGLLRNLNKNLSDDKLDEMLDDAIVIFRFLHGKDVFEAFYKRDLAKRLLLDRSASVDAEKSVLSKLRNECGAGFTHKLEGMFKDMETSVDLNQLFQQHLEHVKKPRSNVNVRVLTTEHWPSYELYEINLPKQLRDSLTDFTDFYRSQHGTRTLNWHYALSTAVVTAKFRPGCTKELILSLYQAVVLLLFNGCEKWTLQEVVDATKIESTEVTRTILSLVGGRDAKPRIICKLPSTSDRDKPETTIESVGKDSFVVNAAFDSKLYRVRVAQVQLKTPKEEKEIVEAEVNHDRQYQIDAAIVRIMKSRKELSHQMLVAELFKQLKFPMNAADIKLRIASLIDREYVARDPNEVNVYRYVA